MRAVLILLRCDVISAIHSADTLPPVRFELLSQIAVDMREDRFVGSSSTMSQANTTVSNTRFLQACFSSRQLIEAAR